ncbi:MAG: hypothetical protein WCQ97_06145 [Aminobacterium sp.]|jgi:hypothetical protein|nr:hypothetical protein [Aminobacterium sp.]MDD3425381.1 hypothetical protein [Aminobacterium sp.]MDD3708023.1 hypothetical protein [Aminobacterium sp.]MDD4228270.1 hypothetical protein [Aminobacterium sp.]MDD4551307.1 hypothetical protein [Aminobacterium sp.]
MDLTYQISPYGVVVIIDHVSSKELGFVNLFEHVTPLEEIVRTMGMVGYKLSESYDFLPKPTFTVWK